MNFFTIILLEIIFVSTLLVYFFLRDIKRENYFLNKHKKFGYFLIAGLFFIILCGTDCFAEPWFIFTNKMEIKSAKISQSLKIAFIADIQIGNHKKTAWIEKIVKKIDKIQPDLILLGGDLIDNEGTFEDESIYLEPLKKLVGKYPIYYILGNHEYGIGSGASQHLEWQTGDRSDLEIAEMKKLNIPLLRNQLECPVIKQQKICIFGIDDIWSKKVSFDELKNWDTNMPLIFLTHNPDGIMQFPKNLPAPDITLAGHTHGGQVRLPFIGPLGNSQIKLPKKYFKGLNDWNGMKIFTTSGIGESAAPIRFLDPPEVAVINLIPLQR